MAEAGSMGMRRKSNGNQFAYIVRGSQDPAMSGSVPAQIFEAEPASVLCRMYNGEWDFAHDEQGRAHVNSDV